MESTFVIIDLVSQSGAVARHVKGWSKDKILLWLSQHGHLEKHMDPYSEEVFLFTSFWGFWTWFFLDNDQFTFIGRHTTFKPFN